MEDDELLNYYRSRFYESEKRLDDLITVLLIFCVVILSIIGYFNGAFADGM